MYPRPIPRSRIILAAMVPFVILALVGLGLTAFQAYRLCFWDRAEATYLGSDPVLLVRGSSTDHTYSEVHYRFAGKDGGLVLLHFLRRSSGEPPEKSIAILYDPSVQGQITREEGHRWDRASSVYLLLCVGIVMAAVGLLACLVGVGLLVRERMRGRASVPPLPRPS
jgi:hypothetical protein